MPKVERGTTVTMEGVRLVYKNFTGRESEYNPEGSKNFAVLLDDGPAEMLAEDGWAVKWMKVREEGDSPQAYLPVQCGWKFRPPRIVMINSRGRINLSEDEVEIFDYADIVNVDLIVRASIWDVAGRSGVKAYCQALYVTIQEDELELKYADVDQIPTRSGRVDEGEAPF